MKFGKIETLQILRAVAAILVVYAHSIDIAVNNGTRSLQSSLYYLQNFGAVGVDIFFVISGFIVGLAAYKQQGVGRGSFIAKRLIRILPLYLIVTSLMLLVKDVSEVSWWTILRSYLFLPSLLDTEAMPIISIAWTLTFEMYFYAVIAFLLPQKGNVVVGAMLWMLIAVGLGWVIGSSTPGFHVISNPLILEFAAGCLLALLYAKNVPISRAAGLAMLGGGVTWLGLTVLLGYGEVSESAAVASSVYSWQRLGYWGGGALLLVAGAIWVQHQFNSQFGKLWVFLGDASYSIYLCSAVVLLVLEGQWWRFDNFGADIGILQITLLTTALGAAFYLAVENPVTKWCLSAYKRATSQRQRQTHSGSQPQADPVSI